MSNIYKKNYQDNTVLRELCNLDQFKYSLKHFIICFWEEPRVIHYVIPIMVRK